MSVGYPFDKWAEEKKKKRWVISSCSHFYTPWYLFTWRHPFSPTRFRPSPNPRFMDPQFHCFPMSFCIVSVYSFILPIPHSFHHEMIDKGLFVSLIQVQKKNDERADIWIPTQKKVVSTMLEEKMRVSEKKKKESSTTDSLKEVVEEEKSRLFTMMAYNTRGGERRDERRERRAPKERNREERRGDSFRLWYPPLHIWSSWYLCSHVPDADKMSLRNLVHQE